MLSDDVLLGIFDFCRNDNPYYFPVWDWHVLVHVCRRWRQIVFSSPHGLNLKILCTHKTPVRKLLGVWPAFPIVIDYSGSAIAPDDEDDIIATLEEHLDRVCFVGLSVTSSQLEKIAAVMQEPFPALNCFHIFLKGGNAPVLPGGFLGGSAPRLQRIAFSGVSCPVLPTLLLLASRLVELELWLGGSSWTDYISPEAMAVSLSALPMLEKFTIEFQDTSLPDRIRPPPTSRTVLPALTSFQFRGVSDYLEDLVAQIEGPQLIAITTAYSNPPEDFPVVQLIKFIDRSVCPRSAIFPRVHVTIYNHEQVSLVFHRQTTNNLRDRRHGITRESEKIHWQTTHFAQALSHVSAALTNVVYLELRRGPGFGGVSDVEWRHLLQHFSNVQTLKLCERLSWRMVRTLQDITEEAQVAGLFASLELIFLQDQPVSSIENFVTLRKHSGHVVTVVNTQTEFDERFKFYVT
jgi:hypothetical protein